MVFYCACKLSSLSNTVEFLFIQCRYLIPAPNAWAAEHNKRPHARLPPSFLGMDAWMTSQLNVALIHKLRASLMCLVYFLTYHLWVFVQPGSN